MRKIRYMRIPTLFAALACVFLIQASISPLFAGELSDEPDGFEESGSLSSESGQEVEELDDSMKEIMDEKGEKELQGVMEKDELGEDMKSETKQLRSRTLKETARTLALQKAVKWRYEKIQDFLLERESDLDDIFDFSPLLMKDGKVLPPVISEAGPAYRVESDTQASSSSKAYRIIKPARMVSKTPDWQDYLLKSYSSFGKEDVQVGVLPKNKKERAEWRKAAMEGWKMGVRQAERLYRTNLNKLKRDYRGIIKFKTLAEQGMVSLPVVAEGEHGIEVQGEELSMDRKVFRITQPGAFQEEEHWKPKIGMD